MEAALAKYKAAAKSAALQKSSELSQSDKAKLAMVHARYAGMLWHLRRDKKTAQRQYKLALKTDPSSVEAHFFYGRFLWEALSNSRLAEEELRATFQHADAKWASIVHVQLGLLLEAREDKSKDAEGEYRAAVVAFEGNQEAHYQLGRFLAPGEEAERVLKRASTLGPTDPRPHWYLMKVMDHKGSLEGAVREARLYVRLGGDEGDERRLGSRELSIRFQKLAEALETRSNFDDAESCFSEAINADPSNSRAHCELGNLLYDVRNDDRGAERSYVAAIAADETALEPHVRLARIHARRGGEGLGKAVEHLELCCQRRANRVPTPKSTSSL
ncbi:hypothetical protein CTAYLR_004982 [Chrysophaeum taylorii]|uniref:Uncharacterized protein n=1 Tax=Chrysophaeum taylorii TaxID=2483200 RepID=A0AAD7XK78_9STRA|nr:hypothetical protein CTAYLR_004982 [Chrysophaeum taylorii]